MVSNVLSLGDAVAAVVAASGDFSGSGFVDAIHALVRVLPTTFDIAHSDFTQCKCRLHSCVEAGVKGGVGCYARAVGKNPVLAGLYGVHGVQGHAFCNCLPDTRAADQRFLVDCLGANLGKGFSDGGGWYRDKYATGMQLDLAQFGSGYCYLDPLWATSRMRSARVLGPRPFVVDLFPVAVAFVRKSAKAWDVVNVGNGDYHVVPSKAKGVDEFAGARFLLELARIIGSDSKARIGYDSDDSGDDGELTATEVDVLKGLMAKFSRARASRASGSQVDRRVTVRSGGPALCNSLDSWNELYGDALAVVMVSPRACGLVHWLHGHGVSMPWDGEVDVVMSTCVAVTVPSYLSDYRIRSGVMSFIGDSVIRVYVGSVVASVCGSKAECGQLVERGSAASLADCSDKCGLTDWCDWANQTPSRRMKAEAYEAVVGVIAWRVGMDVAFGFLDSTGVFERPAYVVGDDVSSRDGMMASANVGVEAADVDLIKAMKLAKLV